MWPFPHLISCQLTSVTDTGLLHNVWTTNCHNWRECCVTIYVLECCIWFINWFSELGCVHAPGVLHSTLQVQGNVGSPLLSFIYFPLYKTWQWFVISFSCVSILLHSFMWQFLIQWWWIMCKGQFEKTGVYSWFLLILIQNLIEKSAREPHQTSHMTGLEAEHCGHWLAIGWGLLWELNHREANSYQISVGVRSVWVQIHAFVSTI